MLAARSPAPPTLSKRDRLLDAAAELFSTHGYQAIGLRDLANHLGIHAGSLYHHIENKQSLLFELIESALADLLLDTKRRVKGAKSPADRLQRFVQAFVAFTSCEKNKFVLVSREFVNLSSEHKSQIDQLKTAYASLLSAIIVEGCGANVRPAEQVHLTTNAVIGLMYGQSQWSDVTLSDQQLTKALTQFVICIVGADQG